MHARGLTPILNVSDFEASIRWFEELGWRKAWDWGDPPGFGGVVSGGTEIFLCHDCQGGRGRSELPATSGPGGSDSADRGVWLSVWVDTPAEVDRIHAACLDAGIEVTWPPTDEPWGVREMHVRHPDGHVLRIGSGLERADPAEPAGPPLPIERVDVPVRLERRLAALLHDLADHKGMDVSSCLEETLLHTFEEVSGGVASPHRGATLDHIQELKRRHGIDYDTHASYRFVEE